jgi:serine/threonine protein kinase/tetratricopeptide (TPR) repeat protein
MGGEEVERRARERLGTTLNGKYRLDALIGIGGMAAVYRASHRNRAQLAVKMLHPELSLNLDIRARFLREGYAANTVSHPGAVLVTDDDIAEDGSAFLVMELLDGASVEELWGGFARKMPLPLAKDIVLQLLDVLAAAHAAGIVHRDIKPANLFVTRSGAVKVLDFGIARVLQSASDGSLATAAGIPMGTPAFMAPEQALGRVAQIDAKTDLWAAGATLFTLLSGETVHDAPSGAEIIVHAATRPARSLSEVAPDVPKGVVEVVDRALAFQAKDRWPSALAMAEALAAASGPVARAKAEELSLAALFPRRTSIPEPRLSGSIPSEMESAPTVSAPLSPSKGSTELPVSSSRIATRPLPRKPRKSLWAIGAMALFVLGLGTLFLFRRPGGNAAERVAASDAASVQPTPPDRLEEATLVVVTDSRNLTGDPVFDGTLDVVLESALKRSRWLYPYAGPAMRGLVNDVAPELRGHDRELGRAIAEKRRHRVVLVHLGVSPEKAAFALSLSARDGATTTDLADLTEVAPSLDAVLPTLAKLACDLRMKLGNDPCDDAARTRGGLGRSLEADHEYAVGRGFLASGRDADALVHLENAARADAEFALAHQALGVTLVNLDRSEEGRSELKLAMAHREGLPPREGIELGAMFHFQSDEFDQSAEDYESLFRRWPVDTHLRGNLAEDYLMMGEVDRSLDVTRKMITENANRLHIRANLPKALLIAGQLEEADRETLGVLAAFPHPLVGTYIVEWLTLLLEGRRAEAIAYIEKVKGESRSLGVVSEADMAMFEGRFTDAIALLKDGIRTDELAKATAYAETKWVMLAEAYARMGDRAHARDAAAHAEKSNDVELILGVARVLARTGARAETEPLVRVLGANPGMRAPLFGRIVATNLVASDHPTKDAVTKAMGDPGKAAGSWLARADLGEALFAGGAFEDAERELAKAIETRGQGATVFYRGSPTLRYEPPVYYWLARTKEALHRPDAQDAYKAFLAMEPNAQGDPLVADAKRREN